MGVEELENGLSAYLRTVAKGETVLVTDRGEIVAEIIAPRVGETAGPRERVLAQLDRLGVLTAAKVARGQRLPRRRRRSGPRSSSRAGFWSTRSSTQVRQLTALLRMQRLDVPDESGHDSPHLLGEHAAHPIEPPSTTLAALQALQAAAGEDARPLARREPSSGRFSSELALAMARAIAAVCALPARPMTARSGAPNCRI